MAAKMLNQPAALALCQLTDAVNLQLLESCCSFWAHTIDAPAGQGPDFFCQVSRVNDGDAIGLIQFTGNFCQQFVGRHTNRAGQASACEYRALHAFGERQVVVCSSAGCQLRRHGIEINIDLVDPTIFHAWGDGGDRGLEEPGVTTVLLKIGRQQ